MWLLVFVVMMQLLWRAGIPAIPFIVPPSRISVGIVLYLLEHGLLYGKAEVSAVAKEQYGNPAFFPLAPPRITDPGSIGGVIGLATQIRELHSLSLELRAYMAVLPEMVAVCALEFLLLRSARRVNPFWAVPASRSLPDLAAFC